MPKTGCLILIILVITLQHASFSLGQDFTQNGGSGNLVQYRPGDIVIAGLMRVHRRGNETCALIQEDGIQAVETMNMIIDQINDDPTILPNITLGTIMVDTCDVDSHALRRVVLEILPLVWNISVGDSSNRIPPVLLAGVVGAASSAVSIQVANLLQVFQISQVSYWSTSPDLSDKARYKYFFRVVPSDTNQASAMIAYVKQQNWTYISVVYEDDFYGVRGYTEIHELAASGGICIATAQSVPRNPSINDFHTIVTNLLKENAKAVIVFTKRNDASDLMIAAQKIGGEALNLIWIGSDGWARQIPIEGSELLKSTTDGSVGFTPRTDYLKDFNAYFSNLTYDQNTGNLRNPWFKEYISVKNKCTFDDPTSGKRQCALNESVDMASFNHLAKMESVADAVLSFVYALKNYHRDVCAGKPGLCADMKELLGTAGLATDIYSYLRNLTFKGVNGRQIMFDANQDGPAVYNILEFNAQKQLDPSASALERWVQSGIYQNKTITWNEQYSNIYGDASSVCSMPCGTGEAKKIGTEICCWICQPCGKYEYVSQNGTECIACSKGYTPSQNKTSCELLPITKMSYGSANAIACITVGSLGIICTTIVTVIYVLHRETAIVKASGRELCFFVLFGIFLTFLNFFPITASPSTASCAISRLILALGPTMMYAGLLAKTMRVVIIFQSRSVLSPKIRAFVRPGPQVLWTFTLVMVQVLIIAIWFASKPPQAAVLYPSEDVAYLACATLVDLPLLYALIYPFILIIICTILATINRNVPTGFNETQYIGFSMYTTCVIWLAFLPIFITNPSNLEQRVMITSICLSLSATTVLVCLFFPRCYTILVHPEENTQKTVMSRTDAGGTPASCPATSNTPKTTRLSSNVNNNNSDSGTRSPQKRIGKWSVQRYIAKHYARDDDLRGQHNKGFYSDDFDEAIMK